MPKKINLDSNNLIVMAEELINFIFLKDGNSKQVMQARMVL